MKTTLEHITPSIAEKYLACVRIGNQRKLSQARAEAFAREMSAKHWMQTHQGIAFDSNGDLIDGQHRLRAIMICGLTIPMLVTRDVPSNMVNGVKLFAIDAIDIGYVRKTGEQLSLRHGIENSNRVAAATRAILVWSTGLQKNTTPIALEILSIYPSIKKLASRAQHREMQGWVIGCLAVAVKTYPNLWFSFIEQYITGVGLEKDSPALLLRNVVSSINCGSFLTRQRIMNCSFNALKAAAQGQKISVLRNNPIGTMFFQEKQKTYIKKIKEAAGVLETTTKK